MSFTCFVLFFGLLSRLLLIRGGGGGGGGGEEKEEEEEGLKGNHQMMIEDMEFLDLTK